MRPHALSGHRRDNPQAFSRRSPPVQVRAEKLTEDGTFEGYGSVFGIVDTYGTIMLPGCFKRTLSEHASEGTRPKGLWQHDWNKPIITWLELSEDNYGLKCKGKFVQGVQQAAEGHILMKAGEIDGLSQSFGEVAWQDLPPDEAAALCGREFTDRELSYLPTDGEYRGTFRCFTDVDLWEISQVTFQSCAPAKADTVRAVAMSAGTTPELIAALAERTRALDALADAVRASRY